MPRDFTPKPAVRAAVPLLIGLSGPPGAGKSMSALMLAHGMKQDRGGEIVVLDTDGDRMKYYAPRPGEKADYRTTFDFQHVSFEAPYSPHDFLDAIRQQLPSNPACVIIDTLSSEHEDEGGVLDWHERELNRMAGNDWDKRERVGQAAWKAPKQARRDLINAILKIKTPLIFTFRAREKVKQIRNDKGKMAPTNIGWTPIAPPEIVGSMTLFCLLPIKSDGVPMWKGNTAYEDFSIKLPAAFRGFLEEGKPITAETGRVMSEWARGVAPAGHGKEAPANRPERTQPPSSAREQGDFQPTPSDGPDPRETMVNEMIAWLGNQTEMAKVTGLEQKKRADIDALPAEMRLPLDRALASAKERIGKSVQP